MKNRYIAAALLVFLIVVGWHPLGVYEHGRYWLAVTAEWWSHEHRHENIQERRLMIQERMLDGAIEQLNDQAADAAQLETMVRDLIAAQDDHLRGADR